MTSDFNIAVHALVYLKDKKELVSSDELAKNICTHPVRVRRVMIKLRQADMIKTKAGVDGGYSLNKERKAITLSEVAKALTESYIHVTWHNGEADRQCIRDSGMEAVMDDVFVDLNNACDNVLKKITIDDIARKIKKKKG